ncbi:DNA mismatch repair protein [Microbotryomycetes sp. JL201]|nr:DNA mismatch repair protein [Microbotryomycetes sp. JL201]
MSPSPGRKRSGARPIVQLSASTSALLRSSVVIPSVPTALLELVRNSIDAGATRIDCTVNLDRWTIKCDDNGRGIALHELDKVARGGADVFDRGWTSKSEADTATFGFRGEALASLAGLGVLEFVTRTRDGRDTVALVVKGGERLHQGSSSVHKSSHGTTVWMRDMYSQYPVRRRPYKTRSAQQNLLNSCRQALETLALVHPTISFSLSDSAATSSSGETRAKRILQIASSNDGALGRWKQLWGRNGIEDVRMFDLADGTVGAAGFFSKAASPSKQFQFVYVNSNPIVPCVIHKTINDCFAQSSFSGNTSSLLAGPSFTRNGIKSVQKSVERYPIFLLNLELPTALVDVTLEPEKRTVQFRDEESVVSFVRMLANAFLVEEHFKQAQPGHSVEAAAPSKTYEAIPEEQRPKKRKLVSGSILSVDSSAPASALVNGADPLTGMHASVETRTGHNYVIRAQPRTAGEKQDLIDTVNLRRQQALPDDAAAAPRWLQNTLSNWTNPVFAASKPFISSLKPVKSGRTSGSPRKQQEWRTNSHHVTSAPDGRISSFFDSRAQACDSLVEDDVGLGQAFDSDSLASCEFIAQIDRKFLLVKIRSKKRADQLIEQESLAVIDQHAASERVRVEKYLRDLCNAFVAGECARMTRLSSESTDLGFDYGRVVVVSAHEADQLMANAKALVRWGVDIYVPPNLKERQDDDESHIVTDYVQVHVQAVPAIIAERLSKDARLLQDFVRSLAQNLPSSTSVPQPRDLNVPWHTVLRQCPSIIVELINSKACRGAIMFNDELTRDESITLINQLARTSFPFQCAHGRPSLVPIVNLPANNAVAHQPSDIRWDLWAP